MTRWLVSSIFYFFFQAEDGIRDRDVTGVQTCALPICYVPTRRAARERALGLAYECEQRNMPGSVLLDRSEERRVGKESRNRWSPNHEKKNVVRRNYGQETCGKDEERHTMLAHYTTSSA